MSKMRKKYDIFISYRREGGSEMAKHLRDTLTERGYRVFLDVESLGRGPFNTALYDVIDNARDFLLILSPGALDRCFNEGDWVRHEIERALEKGKNIVPVMLKDFAFPETLPDSIDSIRMQNGPAGTNIEYYDAYVTRLEEFLESKPRPLWMRLTAALAAVAVIVAVAFTVRYCVTTYPLTRRQKNLVSSAISYMTLNLNYADHAGSQYLKALNRAQQYVEGRTTDSKATVRLDMNNYRNAIDKQISSLTTLPDALFRQLTDDGSRIDPGNLSAMKAALKSMLSEYLYRIDLIKKYFLEDSGLRTEFMTEYIDILRSLAELDGEMFFYQLNEMVLPVTNESALTQLKNEYLPMMSFVYAKRINLSHDRDVVMGNQEAIFQQYERQYDRRDELLERESHYVDSDMIREEIEYLERMRENLGIDTTQLVERLRNLLVDKEKLEDDKQALADAQDENQRLREEAYEKFKPLEDDEQGILWGKGRRFITMKMPAAAAECFSLYIEHGDEVERICGTAGLRFAENYERLGIPGGVVIGLYEEGLPHQAVELGDIIYAVGGEPILNDEQYSDATAAGGKFDISVLRFTATGYETLSSVIDTSLGRLGMLSLAE